MISKTNLIEYVWVDFFFPNNVSTIKGTAVIKGVDPTSRVRPEGDYNNVDVQLCCIPTTSNFVPGIYRFICGNDLYPRA
jgi:hypothetical protein